MKATLCLLMIVLFLQCQAQENVKSIEEPLTLLTFHNKIIMSSNFGCSEKDKFGQMPYGNDLTDEEYKNNKIKIYRVQDKKKIILNGVSGTDLFIVVFNDTVAEYRLRIEGITNVKKLSSFILKKYPTMKSYEDGVLRFKQFTDKSTVLQMEINNRNIKEVFMDVEYTKRYDQISCMNMFKNYDLRESQDLEVLDFKYNAENKGYEIKKIKR